MDQKTHRDSFPVPPIENNQHMDKIRSRKENTTKYILVILFKAILWIYIGKSFIKFLNLISHLFQMEDQQ